MSDAPVQLSAAGTSAKEPEIHVIPDQFYGIAGKARLPAASAMPKPSPTPSAAPQTPGAPVAESKKWLLIPVIAGVVLIVLGVVAWVMLSKKPAPAPAPKPKAAVTLPPIEPAPTPAPEPEPVPEPAPAPEPTPEPEPVPEPATSTPPVPEPAPSAAATDSDGDLLSDKEEGLFGTDSAKKDSDDDGFTDSVELTNLYNPAGFKPTKLLDAGLVAKYFSAVGKYEVLYPTPWTKAEQTGGEVRFDNTESQPVAISIEDNLDKKPVLDWYAGQNASVTPSQVKTFTTKQGYEAVTDIDGFTVYVSAGGKIFIIAYAPGLQENAHFLSTLAMMVNSFIYRP